MELTKKEKLVQKLENHLRRTSRQLIKFDTQKETLQFLSDSVCSQLSCDFVGILIKDGDSFISKVWSGGSTPIKEAFPIKVGQCNPSLLTRSMMFSNDVRDTSCKFTKLCINEGLPTWFTVPLTDELNP